MAKFKVGRCLLQEKLNESKMTQQELASRLKVSKQQINKYVTDRQKMSLKTAKEISETLSCDMDDLYEWIRLDEAGGRE